MTSTGTGRKRVVVVGAGFGGLTAARALAKAPVDVTVIDRRNFHLFQPLLYQVATAALSPGEIAAPIRRILRDQANARVVLGKVTGVDPGNRLVSTEDGRALPYDWLVLATGARHSYFGRDDWAEAAPGIKTIDDATRVRAKILIAFERAEIEEDSARREALLTFVVVGGGPTGVELAGAIAELARKAIRRDFRTIMPDSARIVLVEAGPRILPQFEPGLAAKAHGALERMGVTVRLGAPVTEVTAAGVGLGQTWLPAATVIWAAGVRASPVGRWLGEAMDGAGRVKVTGDFSTIKHAEIFVIGDAAHYTKPDGAPIPGLAPAAKQAGQHVGRLIAARAGGGTPPAPFRYRHQGSLATVGRKFAICDFGRMKFSGFPGWALWSLAHVWFLVGFRNRLAVASSWAWQYVTWERGVRLITGRETAVAETPALAATSQREAD